MAKDRPIEKVDAYFGDFTKQIARVVKKKGKVRILDAGCGFGVAMMGFVKRFGDKVEMVGYNYSKKDGDIKKMKQQAIEKGIFTKKELKEIKKFPKIIYCDASKKLPFKDNTFDFIYSMASLYLYDDKIFFLEECSRILKKDGLARISPGFGEHNIYKKKVKTNMQVYWQIWNKGEEVKMWDYANRIKGVKAVWKNKGKGDKPMYIEITGKHKVDFKLRLIAAIDFNFIYEKWLGVKSIYTTQLKGEFKPHWKVGMR
jgi:ubiquinone/menaquinone biosynthesis C-methylase UbiE